jgi:hypothetical protein
LAVKDVLQLCFEKKFSHGHAFLAYRTEAQINNVVLEEFLEACQFPHRTFFGMTTAIRDVVIVPDYAKPGL